MSASPSIPVVVASPSTASATPTDADTLSGRSPTRWPAPQASSSASATNATSSSLATSSQTTTNSSPPSRATVSPSRTTASRRRASSVSSSSPTPVPERVVDGLEVVDVEHQHRQHRAAPRGPAQRGVDPVQTSARLGSPVSGSCSAWCCSCDSRSSRRTAAPITAVTDSRKARSSSLHRCGLEAGDAHHAPGAVGSRDRVAQRAAHPEPLGGVLVREAGRRRRRPGCAPARSRAGRGR